ncbi:ABC transporter permease subunit [Erysipelothrix anatis]|uniref:ABC transporter permease subunit n=1 Tax=Erysipelothrix anatis TaxID=2683713 RepID=UPI001358FB10|nr:ABC transporter permease subunit [Erysipelothrix anatis]
MNKRSMRTSIIVIGVVLVIAVILPVLKLVSSVSSTDIAAVVGSEQFPKYMMNSLITASIATILSVLIALCCAWAINRTNIKYKSAFAVLFTLPMLIPSISHGTGLVLLLGDNGIITNLLGINIGLYGYPGIILGSILYSFPVAFLMLTDIYKYEDYTVYEAATVLGLSKRQQFVTITLPNLKVPLIAAFFAVFTMIFTDYGVPLAVGGKTMTLSTYMYREVIGLLNFSKGAVIGAFLLIPAIIAFIIDLKSEKTTSASTITKEYIVEKNKKRDRIAILFCTVLGIVIVTPLISFLILSLVTKYPVDLTFSLVNIEKAFDIGVGMYLLNSLAVALFTGLIGVVITYLTAYITARSDKKLSTLAIHFISLTTLAIPGVVLGLSYVMLFNGSIIYGTIAILVLVNIIHFFASPYLMAYNSLQKFNQNLEDTANTLGISKMRLLFDVYIPSTKETVLEMFLYFFINAMITISAVSFLANMRNQPLSLLIPQLDSQSMIESTAFISILILFVNVSAKVVVSLVKKHEKEAEV